MALEDTDNLDNNQDNNGNGDEQSNRTFRLLMLGMGCKSCWRIRRKCRRMISGAPAG